MRRRLAAACSVAASLACLAPVAPARAQVAPVRCESAYEGAQLQRQRGKLLAAREESTACAREVCPEVARKDCARWTDELAHEIPTVVVVARDPADRDVPGVRVLVDGVARPEAVSGRPFELDPGVHAFRVERPDGRGTEQSFTLYQGEHDRLLRVALPAEVPAPRPLPPEVPAPGRVGASPRGSLVPAIVVGGLSVAAFAASAVLGLTGRQELSDLRSSCAPACTDAQVDPVRTRLVASDVTLGVGLVGTAVAVSLFLLRGDF
jgi:hypothetical protein